MRGLRLTCFVLAFLCLSAQLVRHTYVRWFEHNDTVLNKYDAVDAEIHDATSLADLEQRYASALQREKTEDAAGTRRGGHEQPTSVKLRQAITVWEHNENDVREVQYFWVCGLFLVALGLFCYWRSRMLFSITLLIAGVGEMVWWTSPSMTLGGAHQEFTRLLNNKLAFTVLSLGVLLSLWFLGALRPEEESDARDA
jgi:hypothetical protein